MNIILIIIIILILILLFYLYNDYYIKKICNNVEIFYYGEKTSSNKTILILGGIHGNEPAGSIAIKKFMEEINSNNTKLNNRIILIPYVNHCALLLNSRQVPFIGDLNRKFPITANYNENDLHPIIKEILIQINQADFVIDFHEGWGYYKDNTGSIGSTITPTNTDTSNTIADLVYDNLNNTIDDNNKKFTILIDESYNDTKIKAEPTKYSKNQDIKYTLRYYASLINKDYILIETSGQNDIQKIDTRVIQARIVIDTVLRFYNTY
jgi:hypothetical protein